MTQPELICGDCGATLGTNKDCQRCLGFLVGRGSEDISEDEARRIADEADRWTEERGSGAPVELLQRFKLSAQMVGDWTSGAYREVPWRTIASIAAAMIYVINPFDLVPDFIAGIGFIDDASVMGFVFSTFIKDLEAYRRWRVQHRGLPDKDSNAGGT